MGEAGNADGMVVHPSLEMMMRGEIGNAREEGNGNGSASMSEDAATSISGNGTQKSSAHDGSNAYAPKGNGDVITTSGGDNGEYSIAIKVSDAVSSDAHEKPKNTKGCGISRAGDILMHFLERRFYKLGHFIARRPILTICISLLVVAVCASGILQLKEENRNDKLWVPTDSRAQSDKKHVEAFYSRPIRVENVIFHTPDFSDVIDPTLLASAASLHAGIDTSVAIVSDGPGSLTYPVTYQAKCYRRGQACWQENPMKVFAAANITDFTLTNRSMLLHAINYVETEKRLGRLPNVPEIDSVFGGIVRDPMTNFITGARTLSFFYFLRNEEILNSNNELIDSTANAWEAVYLRLIDTYNIQSLTSTVPGQQRLVAEKFATRSFEDEFGKTIDGDLLLLNFAIAIILVYAVLMMSRWDLGVIRGARVSLSIGAVVSVGLAIAAAYGFCSYAGFFFSKLMNLLPFLLLGIGVDDAFILIGALDNVSRTITVTSSTGVRTTRTRTTVERVAAAVASAGPSITVTSLTDFCAFVIGSNTSLPALSTFSIYAAFGILFDYFLQITLFVAFMTLDARRMRRRSADIACCMRCLCCRHDDASDAAADAESLANESCVTGLAVVVPEKKATADTTLDGVNTKDTMSNGNEEVVEKRNPRSANTFFGRTLGNILSMQPAKAIVVFLFVSTLAMGISGTVQIPVQADIDNFIPPNSYLKEWYDVQDTYYNRVGASVAVYTVNYDIFGDAPLRPGSGVIGTSDGGGAVSTHTRLALHNAFQGNPSVAQGSVNDWFTEFTASGVGQAALTTNNKTFCYESLSTWLQTPTLLGGGAIYANDVKFVDPFRPSLGLLSSRALGNHVKTSKSQRKVKMMDSLRTSAASVVPIGAHSFVYSDDYIQWEQYKAVGVEAIRNVSLILGVVFLVTFALLARPSCSTVVFLCIAATAVEIIGFMHYWSLTIDSVTVIMLVLSLGLSVDYSVHIGHAYLTSIDEKNDPNTRMKMALEKQGVAVFNGAFSTWLAVVCLATSQSYVFLSFFRILLLCTTFGLFNGLFVLPVLLSLVNPEPFEPSNSDSA